VPARTAWAHIMAVCGLMHTAMHDLHKPGLWPEA
jgi:hypothetical protein